MERDMLRCLSWYNVSIEKTTSKKGGGFRAVEFNTLIWHVRGEVDGDVRETKNNIAFLPTILFILI